MNYLELLFSLLITHLIWRYLLLTTQRLFSHPLEKERRGGCIQEFKDLLPLKNSIQNCLCRVRKVYRQPNCQKQFYQFWGHPCHPPITKGGLRWTPLCRNRRAITFTRPTINRVCSHMQTLATRGATVEWYVANL